MGFVHRYKRFFLVGGMIICVVAIILTANPDFSPSVVQEGFGYVLMPLQRGATASVRWITEKFASFRNNERIREENIALKENVMRLEIENNRLSGIEEENFFYNLLFEMKVLYSEIPTVGARIIAKDPSDWYDSYSIDLGSEDGIERHMAVIGYGGLAGVVREVYSTHSKVVSVIDDRFSAYVMNIRTEDKGILSGDINLMAQGLCRMGYIEADAQIMAGDILVTSPYSSFFPPGIEVGRIMEVRAETNGLTQYAIVEPFAMLNFMDMVLVVNKLFGDVNEINMAGE